MATQTQQFTFNRFDFTQSSPSWSSDGDYSKGLRFNTLSKSLRLDNTNYKKLWVSIQNTGGFDVGKVHFSTPNGSIVSASPENNSLYLIQNLEQNPADFTFKNEEISTTTKIFYVIVNGDPDKLTDILNISISLAKNGSIPSSNINITIQYECNYQALYSYTTGLHVYSPYDAKSGSSKLTTKLYSTTAINGWGVGTTVYSDPYFSNPALPYYYGYNGKVYRVGDRWSRSYGVRFKYTVRVKKRLFRKPKVGDPVLHTIGPEETLDNNGGGTNKPTSKACIEPTMKNVGKIRWVYDNDSTISQPQQYRYYMGYDATNERNSNDSVFTQWDFSKKKGYPITGFIHSLQKFNRGITLGYDINAPLGAWYLLTAATGVATYFATGALGGISGIFSTIFKFFASCGCHGVAKGILGAGKVGSASAIAGGFLAGLLTAFLVIGIAFLLFKLFSALFGGTKTHHFEEKCNDFLHHFTTGSNAEYIMEGATLHRDSTLQEVNSGYYCDGVYFYYQNGGSIQTKKLSSTNALISNEVDPPIFEYMFSVTADVPTLVTEFSKLVLLPYCSGKPEPYCGANNPIYYSSALTHTISVNTCDLEVGEDKVINLPYGSAVSCLSQADADDEATAQFQAAIDYAENHGEYNTSIDDSYISVLDCNFTHEIKEENNPTEVTLYWDNRSGSNAPVGTPLYYNITGCQKALPGYYATSGSNYPKYYYEVANGEVAAIYTQSAASSTTTTTGQNIIKTNEDKTSNWYLKSTSKHYLVYYVLTKNDRTFNLSSLFTTSPYELSAGRIISGSYTNGAFEKYDTFDSNGITTTETTEQGTGWYIPLNDWKPEQEEAFYYQNSLTQWTGGIHYTTSGSAICAGSNTGNTYYHDGESTLPGLGDKIYDTNDIEDPTADGFIKYTTDLYLTVTDGVMVDSTNCNAQTNFSGSTLQTSPSLACNASTNQTLYTHDGSGTYPSVGDTVTVFGGSTVSDGFINTDIGVLHMDDDGMVLQIISCPYDALPADMEVGFNSILGTTWYGYSDPNNLHIASNTVMGDANELVNGFLNDSLDKIAESELGYHLITWLGWKDNNIYLTLRGTDTAITSWDYMSIKTDLLKTGTHVSGDYGGYFGTTNNNIYLTSPSGNGSEDYATSIISGMSVTGTGVPASTVVNGTPSYSSVVGIWTIPVNNTVTYSSVDGETITFAKNNHTVYYYRTSATLTTYTNKTDSSGGTGDFLVYKWSSTYNPFVGSGQDVIIDFNSTFYSP